jgi:hypothetical protein
MVSGASTAMASPHLVDPIKPVDAVDALRLLVADLQALADRLGLKQNNRALHQSLDALEHQVFGPRTVVLLMGETAAVKRSFLERLLGPQLAQVPEPVSGPLRLEHGAEASCSVILPQGLTAEMPLEQLPEFLARQGGVLPHHSRETVRLPNPILSKGLAVVDTPAADAAMNKPHGNEQNRDDQSPEWFRESAAGADCWIFVLGVDQPVSERSLAMLRQLPRPCPQLDIVIEGAEGLSGEARQTERERLLSVLREHCGLEEVRLTLLASPAAEGEGGSFWHGRFATFQQVTLLRGREHWLHTTREAAAKELAAVAEEIHSRLRDDTIDMQQTRDVQQARLRMGQKDLDLLRTRLDELGMLSQERRQVPSLVSAVVWPEESGVSAAATASAARVSPAPDKPAPERTVAAASATPPQPLAPPWRRAQAGATAAQQHRSHASAVRSASAPLVAGWAAAQQARLHRRHAEQSPGQSAVSAMRGKLSVPHALTVNGMPYRAAVHNLSAAVGLLFKPSPVTEITPASVRRRNRVLLVAAIVAAIWLVLWAVWPSGANNSHTKPQWNSSMDLDTEFQLPPIDNPDAAVAPTPTHRPARFAGSREVIADPTFTDLGISRHRATTARQDVAADAPSKAPAKPSAAVRETAPLSPSTSDAAANAPPRKAGRRRLGLGKVWHWIRRDDPVSSPAIPGLLNASVPSAVP